MTSHPAAEPITEPHADHGEGPVWSADWGGLRWVDMHKGDILALETDGVRRIHVGSVAAAFRPRRGGGMVVGVERGFALVDPDGTVRALPEPEVWTDPSVRMNDGGCDPDGRFYCGSMAYDEAPGRGSLYRLDADGRVSLVLSGVSISNGMGFSPDGATAYYIDTPTHGVDVFDYDTERGLHDRRRLISIDPDLGVPDGMTVDSDGCLWVAMHGGAAVLRFRPDGAPDGRIDVPVRDVTACTFGGADLDRLFITTSRAGGDTAPMAGAVFAADVGVRGLPALPYAG